MIFLQLLFDDKLRLTVEEVDALHRNGESDRRIDLRRVVWIYFKYSLILVRRHIDIRVVAEHFRQFHAAPQPVRVFRFAQFDRLRSEAGQGNRSDSL